MEVMELCLIYEKGFYSGSSPHSIPKKVENYIKLKFAKYIFYLSEGSDGWVGCRERYNTISDRKNLFMRNVEERFLRCYQRAHLHTVEVFGALLCETLCIGDY